MVFNKLSRREKVYTADIGRVVSTTNLSSTHGIKELMINGKLYFQVNTIFIYVYNHNHTHYQ